MDPYIDALVARQPNFTIAPPFALDAGSRILREMTEMRLETGKRKLEMRQIRCAELYWMLRPKNPEAGIVYVPDAILTKLFGIRICTIPHA